MRKTKSGGCRPVAGVPDGRFPRLLTAAALALLLQGCGGSAPESFDLSAVRAGAAGAAHGQLVVNEPLATAPGDSDRIIVRPTPDTLAALKGAQWVERLPRLVQTRMVQSFENSRLLASVGRPDAKIQATMSLSSEIRRFEIDVGAGEAIVEISVKLIAERSGRIAAARIFTASAPGSAASGTAAAAALDQALGEALRQIVVWTAARARGG